MVALAAASEKLLKDLQPLHQQLVSNKESLLVSDDGDQLLVFAPAKYKAYVPKRYDGFDVAFIDWNGDDLQLDLNGMICND
jgi:hypothetical protein